jgi:hypothetical protein
MTRFIEWMVSLLIVIAIFVVIGLFLPASRTVSHSVQTNRPMATVNDIYSGFARFRDWSTLPGRDPRMQMTVSGPETGEGAKLAFRSNEPLVGEGSWTLVEQVPGERIVYAIEDRTKGHNKRMSFRFERTGQRNQNVEITQRYTVDYGWNLLARYAGLLYVTRDAGAEIKGGLAKVSNLLATIPRFDYSQHEPGFQFTELPAINVLLVSTNAKRANDDIAVAMTNQLKWIEQVMEKNELEPAGPMRIVTNEFTTDTYGFDVVMPIRPKGTGPAEPQDAAEGEAAGDEAVTAPTAPAAAPATVDMDAMPERLDVKVEGPVIYAHLPAMRVATTTYTGPSPGLPRVRDLTRAWAIVRGAETTDRPFEQYHGEIRDMLAEDAEFSVFWPVRVGDRPSPSPVQIQPPPGAEGSAPAPAAGESGDAEAAEEADEAEAEAAE